MKDVGVLLEKGEGRTPVRAISENQLQYWFVAMNHQERTRGGLRYSIPMLRALFDMFSTSFTRLYLSTLKLSVGPAVNLTIRNDGAIGVRVNASK